MAKKVEKTRASGTKTEKGYMSHIVSILRSGTLRWTPKWQVMNDGREKRLNTATGKLAYHNSCQVCNQWFKMSELKADHIDSIGKYLDRTTIESFIATLGNYATRMFCEVDGLQRICETCHAQKTTEDRAAKKNQEE